jgi:hypothetical protein
MVNCRANNLDFGTPSHVISSDSRHRGISVRTQKMEQLFRIWRKAMWWCLIFGSAFALVFLPGAMIYDAVFPWREARQELGEKFHSHHALFVGAGQYQRSYILLPRVFEEWSIVSVTKLDSGKLDVHEEGYLFILYLSFWVPVLSFGAFYSVPKILGLSKNRDFSKSPHSI